MWDMWDLTQHQKRRHQTPHETTSNKMVNRDLGYPREGSGIVLGIIFFPFGFCLDCPFPLLFAAELETAISRAFCNLLEFEPLIFRGMCNIVVRELFMSHCILHLGFI